MFARDMLIATYAEASGLRDYRMEAPGWRTDVPLIPGGAAMQPHSYLAVGPYGGEPGEVARHDAWWGRRRRVPRHTGRARSAHREEYGDAPAAPASAAARAYAGSAPGAFASGARAVAILLVVAIATAIDVSTQAQGRVALCVTAATLLSMMALDS